MNKTRVILIILCVVGCLVRLAPAGRSSEEVKARDAIQIAKQEIKRHKVSLPKNYNVTITEGNAFFEFEQPRTIYVVSFAFADRGKRRVVYTVHVDKRSGKVDAFSDSRILKSLHF